MKVESLDFKLSEAVSLIPACNAKCPKSFFFAKIQFYPIKLYSNLIFTLYELGVLGSALHDGCVRFLNGILSVSVL